MSRPRLRALTLALAAFVATALPTKVSTQSGMVPHGIDATVGRFLAGSSPSLTSYVAIRHLTASTRGGRMQASLRARTELHREHGFRFDVVESSGSAVIQKRVLVAALEAERQIHASGAGARGALTTDNYEFVQPAEGDPVLVRVDLRARRRESLLLDGAMFLSPYDFDLVRVEGELVRRPSFWTRRVTVVRRFARVAGVRVPVALESTAQVFIVGTSSFAMRYDYEMVNGTAVPHVQPSTAQGVAPRVSDGLKPVADEHSGFVAHGL